MNPDLMTVLSMRQKEMSYHQLALDSRLSPATSNNVFGANSPLQSPLKTPSPHSPESVRQLPLALSLQTAQFEQFGFTWRWIVEAATHFALQRQTAHFANQYAQVLLRQRAAQRGAELYALRNYDDVYAVQRELRVLGLACVFMAAKIEEVHPPKAAELAAFMTERGGVTLAGDDLVKLEGNYAQELKWNLHPTTPYSWLLFMVAGGSADQRPLSTMGDFVSASRNLAGTKELFVNAIRLVDIGLLDYQALEYWPSVLAGAALLLVDPALELMFVAQFLQLDPTMLWECKSWLYTLSYSVCDLEGTASSHSKDRWAKLPEEEYLFVQSPVVVPNHLGGGLLRPENTAFMYPMGMLQGSNGAGVVAAGLGGFPSSTVCPSPCSPSDDFAMQYGSNQFHACGGAGMGGMAGGASSVYHFKYGWQAVDPALLYEPSAMGSSNQDGYAYP